MPNRIVRSRFPSRGTKRLTEWALCTSAAAPTVLAAGTKAVVVLFSAAALVAIAPATIVRSRMLLSISSDQSGASEVQIGALGVGIVNDVAGALGVTALPGPVTDCGWPGWFVHQWFFNEFQFISGTGTQSRVERQYEIDSKAMRKLKGEEALVIMIENFGISGMDFHVSSRFLTKAG